MEISHTDEGLVTRAELDALFSEEETASDVELMSARAASHLPLAVDTWFKFRNLFLLSVVFSYCIKLLFFSHVAVSNYQSHMSDETFVRYFQYRALFVIAITVFYLYSYLRNWFFEKVSLVFVGVGATALAMDYFNAYVYLSENPTQWIAGLIALRLGAIFCLLMNAMNARRAPAMPRYLWS
ncbi:hypothetical protein [Limnohabitans sp. JirII-31]|uniref:hypothetical protein n=1 Tax=Limnohabitans sp. JirII-31 TaxID=1977908 RepID=UPI000C1E261A|nr:hypothetical protein [Limnohabitans sp. JirII-31]PIT79439.1 hypothetical protein B9Z41_05750 [Limnohabitans sp. JirII-31]